MGWFCLCKELSKINRTLKRIARALEDEAVKDPVLFGFSVGQPQRKERTPTMPLSVTTTNEEKIKITVTPVTSTGNPAPLDGPVSVTTVSGESTSTMIDDTSFFLVSSDNPGDSTFLVEADADLGGGVVLIQDTVTYTVSGALAANLGLSAGTPEPK